LDHGALALATPAATAPWYKSAGGLSSGVCGGGGGIVVMDTAAAAVGTTNAAGEKEAATGVAEKLGDTYGDGNALGTANAAVLVIQAVDKRHQRNVL